MFLGILILFLTGAAFLHFIIDGILAPSALMAVRIELCTKAEELDGVHKKSGHSFNKDVFRILRGSLHNLISNMSRYNLTTVAMVKVRYEHDNEFSRDVRERIALIDSCDLSEVKDLRTRLNRLADRILTWNSLGWVIYVVPFIVAAFMYRSTQRGVKVLLALSGPSLEKFSDDGTSGSNSRMAW